MRTSYVYIIGAFALGLLGSCSDDTFDHGSDKDRAELPITLAAAYPSSTRATDTGFEDGDRMGVYVLDYIGETPQNIAEDAHAYNVRFDFNEADEIWKSNSKIYWTSKDTPADIIAYYPYDNGMQDAKSYAFSIQRRQDLNGSGSSTGGYEASDLLWAKAEKAMPSGSRVDLTFRHMMAGVRVSLAEGSGFAAGEWENLDKSVLVPNIKPVVNIDIESGSLGDAYGDAVAVHAYTNGEDWRAVVVPQTIPAETNVIDITVDGISYHLTKKEPISYVGGKLSTFTITVDKRADGKGYEFNLTDEAITPWIDDLEFREGIVRNYLSIEVPERGTLKDVMSKRGLVPATVTGLKLSGELDEVDFHFLREECRSLKALNLTDAVVWEEERKNVIPQGALANKKTLTHFVFPKYVEIIGSDAFYNTSLTGSLRIPEGVVKIGELPYIADNYGHGNQNYGAFAQCVNLRGELILPSSLEFIEDCAFAWTKFTGNLNIPENVKVIGNWAFMGNKFGGDLIIPESVREIGAAAFQKIPFNGTLVLPDGIEKINPYTFSECGFSGILSLPEGLIAIEKYAFSQCGFRGELVLPSSLQRISNRVFSETKISSVVFPENLSYIGDGAFMNCRFLRGSVVIPDKVLRVNRYLFCGCSQLAEVILHKDILTVEGAALYGCTSLNHLVCNNPEPPKVNYLTEDVYGVIDWGAANMGPFDGISKNNFTLEVPKESVDAYRRANGWKEFSRIAEYSNFICRPSTACALNSRHTETLTINSDGEWEVAEKPDWCSLSGSEGNLKAELTLTIDELTKGASNREGKIVFRLKGTDITTDCTVSQFDYRYSENECVTLQKASAGNGIDILFVGDGWDAASIADESYMDLVNEQMDAFFGIEPYSTYRDRFNVFACISLSQETGVNTAATWRNTKFSTFYAHDCNGNGSLQLDEPDEVFDYAVAHSPLTAAGMPRSLVIMTLNSDEYGSATTITDEGSCIAICCSSPDTYPMDTRGIIQHEACGHGFGKLAEERIVKNGYISNEEKNIISEYQWRDWYQNISISGKMSDVGWSDLIFDPRYSNSVDIFEGAYGKTRGVYRAEINSCMNYGIPYFSAPARLDIMRRILDYSGEGFSMEKFYATDSDKWGPTGTTRAAMPDAANTFVNSGMHHPVRIVKSKKY